MDKDNLSRITIEPGKYVPKTKKALLSNILKGYNVVRKKYVKCTDFNYEFDLEFNNIYFSNCIFDITVEDIVKRFNPYMDHLSHKRYCLWFNNCTFDNCDITINDRNIYVEFNTIFDTFSNTIFKARYSYQFLNKISAKGVKKFVKYKEKYGWKLVKLDNPINCDSDESIDAHTIILLKVEIPDNATAIASPLQTIDTIKYRSDALIPVEAYCLYLKKENDSQPVDIVPIRIDNLIDHKYECIFRFRFDEKCITHFEFKLDQNTKYTPMIRIDAKDTYYKLNKTVTAYLNASPFQCASGLHFFATKEEALDYFKLQLFYTRTTEDCLLPDPLVDIDNIYSFCIYGNGYFLVSTKGISIHDITQN